MAYILLILIVAYSGWIIYRTLRKTAAGSCTSCSGCSLNGSCPLQSSKSREESFILRTDDSSIQSESGIIPFPLL